MSKKNRQPDLDIEYFRKTLCQIDEGIDLPRSLTSEALLPLLDGLTAENRPGAAAAALSFLRSRMFSIQYAVSYAVAFVLIIAVAHGMRSGGDFMGGGLIRTQNLPESAVMAVEQGAATDISESALDAGSSIISTPEAAPDTASAPQVQASLNEAVIAPRLFSGEDLGAGGGGETELLGQDEKYIYMCRYNDRTDPDKADFPVTIELIGAETNEGAGFIDISDIETVTGFYTSSGVVCIVGQSGGDVVSRLYLSAGSDDGVSDIAAVPQTGAYIASHLVDGILRVVTLDESGNTPETDDIQNILLPNAVSTVKCIVTSINITTGEFSRTAFTGADSGISLFDSEIHLSYSKSGQSEPDTVQVSFNGLELDTSK